MRPLVVLAFVICALASSAIAAIAAPVNPVPRSGGIDLAVVRTDFAASDPIMPGDSFETLYVVSAARNAELWIEPKVDAQDALAQALTFGVRDQATGERLAGGRVTDGLIDIGALDAGQPRALLIDVSLPAWVSSSSDGHTHVIAWSFVAAEDGAR
jgi:hypothetical protein